MENARAPVADKNAQASGSSTNFGAVDYRRAFQDAPVGQMFCRNRLIVDVNFMFADMFRATREELIGHSTQRLFPSASLHEETGKRIAPLLRKKWVYADDRVMRRQDDELFWVHVSGFSWTPDDPHRETIWAFTDLSEGKKLNSELRGSMTPRERDIAALLIAGRNAKEIGISLGISPRTVDIYKTRLFRKYSVASSPELVKRLLAI